MVSGTAACLLSTSWTILVTLVFWLSFSLLVSLSLRLFVCMEPFNIAPFCLSVSLSVGLFVAVALSVSVYFSLSV